MVLVSFLTVMEISKIIAATPSIKQSSTVLVLNLKVQSKSPQELLID